MNKKKQQLKTFTTQDVDGPLTTNQGLKMDEDNFSLKAGRRGSTLLEDFHLREKITHFDHERIPERVVHARGYGAHGTFTCTKEASKWTKAHFLNEVGRETPIFVRFSNVAGSKGSSDVVRDVRGFATKFYTEEGNFDLVGNNIPVFYIQDAIKFPDLIHAVKPEPHNEIPQAQSAHDTFWDFVSQHQESTHMLMWHLSDRAIPKNLRMMEGFGVHTFRLINAQNESFFVKFHLKPQLGVHSVTWDEAQKINGKDPDFHRRDLYEAIERGDFPVWDFGVQVIPEAAQFDFDFDVLDATKLWPEEQIPVEYLGELVLNENVDNVFAETEQVAFHPGHVVPGIDFSDDPLLQGRLFSYTDTQLSRLGGPNFHEIPINRPVCPFTNNQRDGMHRQTINPSVTSYYPNALADNQPAPVPEEQGGFHHFEQSLEGKKVRERADSFLDFYSQATMFYESLADYEQQHLKDALVFELGKCKNEQIRKNVINQMNHVHHDLAKYGAQKLGLPIPSKIETPNVKTYPSLSQATTPNGLNTKTVGVIVSPQASAEQLKWIRTLETKYPIVLSTISNRQGTFEHFDMPIDETFDTTHPVLFDSLLVINTFDAPTDQKTIGQFLNEAYDHAKPIASTVDFLTFPILFPIDSEGVYMLDTMDETPFIEGLTIGRFWKRGEGNE